MYDLPLVINFNSFELGVLFLFCLLHMVYGMLYYMNLTVICHMLYHVNHGVIYNMLVYHVHLNMICDMLISCILM